MRIRILIGTKHRNQIFNLLFELCSSRRGGAFGNTLAQCFYLMAFFAKAAAPLANSPPRMNNAPALGTRAVGTRPAVPSRDTVCRRQPFRRGPHGSSAVTVTVAARLHAQPGSIPLVAITGRRQSEGGCSLPWQAGFDEMTLSPGDVSGWARPSALVRPESRRIEDLQYISTSNTRFP